MKKNLEVLCEIIFADHILGHLASRIGMVNEFQLRKYSTNSNDFIIFKEKYNSPILRADIKEIIIHRDNTQTQFNKEDSKIRKHIKAQSTGKIS